MNPALISHRVARRYAAKSKGVATRSALNNIKINLNNLSHSLDPKDAGPPFFQRADSEIRASINDITKQVFKVHVPEVKKYIVDETLEALKDGLKWVTKGQAKGNAPAKSEAEAVQYAVYLAQNSLKVALEKLEQNPDSDEQKEHLAHTLKMLLPSGHSEDTWYNQAIQLSGELSKSEKGKNQAFFSELKKGLESAYEGYQELRSAAAMAYKMLPKV